MELRSIKDTKNFSEKILLECNIKANKRPEELDFEDYINLANSFNEKKL